MAEYQRSFDALDGQEEASSSGIVHEVLSKCASERILPQGDVHETQYVQGLHADVWRNGG
jgi:hypothetical protein